METTNFPTSSRSEGISHESEPKGTASAGHNPKRHSEQESIPCKPISKEIPTLIIEDPWIDEYRGHMSKHALICRFIGVRLNEKALCWWINQKWKPKGDFELQLGSRSFFTVIFAHKEDRDRIFEGGPYFYNSAGLYITYWRPNFAPEQEDFKKVPVWICLHSMHVDYWNKRILEAIGNKLGVFIKASDLTSQGKYTAYARICVYLDISGPLPGHMELIHRGVHWKQTIDYENIPFRCRTYRQHGHLSYGCPVNQSQPKAQQEQGETPAPGFTPVSRKNKGKRSKKAPKQPTNSTPTNMTPTQQNSFDILGNLDSPKHPTAPQAPTDLNLTDSSQPMPTTEALSSISNPTHAQAQQHHQDSSSLQIITSQTSKQTHQRTEMHLEQPSTTPSKNPLEEILGDLDLQKVNEKWSKLGVDAIPQDHLENIEMAYLQLEYLNQNAAKRQWGNSSQTGIQANMDMDQYKPQGPGRKRGRKSTRQQLQELGRRLINEGKIRALVLSAPKTAQ